jgi:hypothetical protein
MVILSYSSPRSHPQSPLLLPFSLLSKRLNLPSYPSFSPIEYSKIVGEPETAKARRQADLAPLQRRVLAPLAGAPIGRQAAGRRMLKGNRLSLHDHRWHRSEAKEYHPGFQRADRRLGLRKIRFHELRHSCATILADQAVNVKIVSKLCEWSMILLPRNGSVKMSPMGYHKEYGTGDGDIEQEGAEASVGAGQD